MILFDKTKEEKYVCIMKSVSIFSSLIFGNSYLAKIASLIRQRKLNAIQLTVTLIQYFSF